MPQVGFKCARGNILHSDCQACSLTVHPCHFTPDLLERMRKRSDDDEPDHHAFSPSRLLGCMRQSVLMDEDYYEDVEHAWAMLRGTIIHGAVEKFPYPPGAQVIREQRLYTEVETKYGPQRFTAKPDIVVVQGVDTENKIVSVRVVDYKTREFGHELVSADKKHQMQVNMYAWLIEHELVVPGFEDFAVQVTGLEIIYLSLSKTRRFTSDGPMLATRKRKAGKHWTTETYELAPVKLMDMEKVGAFIRGRIERKIDARQQLPPILEGEEARICFRCPVYAQCMALGNQSEVA